MSINSLIDRADIEKVSEGLQSVKINNLRNQLLLPNTNLLLCGNPGKIIERTPDLSVNSFKEYMAVSTFVHTIDGWSYLSNAISAFLNGDPSITIHLAYYAELRAAIAFLSSEGILIANNEQACIDRHNILYVSSKQPKALRIFPKGTHSATWNIINGWILNNTKTTYALEYFTYRGISFKNLVQFIPYALNTDAGKVVLLKKWLKTWCFDIQKYEEDKEGRNASTYNPNIHRDFNYGNLKDNLNILNEFWMLLEPSTDRFSKLDQYLFALYLKEVFNATISCGIFITKENFITEFYQNSGLPEDSVLTNIFMNQEESSLIRFAKNHDLDPNTGDVYPLSIIARSILLLRFSCGSCAFLLKKNNIVKSDIDFYINKVGQDYGLWNISSPLDLKDLWTDISDLLNDFDEYFRTNNPSNLLNLKQTFIEYSDIYTQFSRVGLWGLGL